MTLTMQQRDILLDLTRNKPGSPAWRKAYARYRRTEHWRGMRKDRLRFCNNCSMCPGKATQVHHRRYGAYFSEDVRDLVGLCARCHMRHHGK